MTKTAAALASLTSAPALAWAARAAALKAAAAVTLAAGRARVAA